ncbi:uncharacterized protein LOC141647339 isoform X3 [Silene latifolia]|uniref:uncharacterized protein LOC141647339 isoform X3 n=1 Tax=Silene latifolia TaxID=37657 RepID=UPI003D78817A
MMDSGHLDQAEKSSPETFSDSSTAPNSPDNNPDNNDIFGDPLVYPRVGEEYQVEIPCILSESERLQLIMNSVNSKGIVDSTHTFLIGLPIPVMWVHNQVNTIKTERLENLDDPHASCTNGFVGPKNSGRKEPKESWLIPDQRSGGPWSDFEVNCFLVGLYMLGKKLDQVAKFVGTKGMGQVLAYYYGPFYGSAGYNRWSECRKKRSRKCVVGHNFFMGLRQQELFSRVFPRLSEESRAQLSEHSRAFADGSISLENYVFTLKAMVGIHALVDAVGIGKRKEDLTLIFDTSKNNQVSSNRHQVPSGKACSALNRAEIVRCLTGDFRLSKARSNDLFWEAVWPRLLARGWHSEQPKGTNNLVFLTPGVKKFSRRKLSKGDHYFDSITDVLAKVASEPELLELEADETDPSCSKVENGWSPRVKSDDDLDSSDQERHCYLKPRVSLGLSDLTKFTVVDTSLANEDNPYKVWELRNLPEEAKKIQSGNVDMSMVPADSFLPMSHNPMNHRSRTIRHQSRQIGKAGHSSCGDPAPKRRRLSSCVSTDVTWVLSLPAKNKNGTLKIIGPKLCPSQSQTDVKKSSGNILVSENHTEKRGHEIDLNLPQMTTQPERNGKVKLEEEASSSNQIFNVEMNTHFKPEISTSPDNMDFCFPLDNTDPCLHSGEPSKTGAESDQEPGIHFLAQKQKNSGALAGPSDNMEPQVSSTSGEPANNAESDQQPRRQSTRSRPLTTKALEALEIGLFRTVRQYRKRGSPVVQDQKPKRSRQPRNSSPVSPQDMEFEIGASEETCNGKKDVVEPPVGSIPNEKENMTRA